MTTVFLIAAIVLGLVVLAIIGRFSKRLGLPNQSLNQDYYFDKWFALLAKVKNSDDGMILAVIDADKLLDEALKKRHFKGKTMGERLVSAQRSLKDNDAVWYAHKVRNRLVHEPDIKLKKSEAQTALAGFKKGLQDLGALK